MCVHVRVNLITTAAFPILIPCHVCCDWWSVHIILNIFSMRASSKSLRLYHDYNHLTRSGELVSILLLQCQYPACLYLAYKGVTVIKANVLKGILILKGAV